MVEWISTTDTNHRHVDLTSPDVPPSFLAAAGFPEHALVVTAPGRHEVLTKGIRDERALEAAVVRCVAMGGTARVLTDMRAHVNPTRRRVLAEVGGRLAARLCQRCPRCATPGWGVVERHTGLPCEWCGQPTRQVAGEVLACARADCAARDERAVSRLAAPGTCERCNP